jgi:transcriptional regulator with XRE-family HTH domain
MIIGHRIRQLREKRGISHDDLQEFSGLDSSYIARIEQGRTVPPLETLERIAAALAVPLYWLFYAEEDASSSKPLVPAPPATAPALIRRPGELQLLKKLKEVSVAPFDADPAFLLDLARRASMGKPEN